MEMLNKLQQVEEDEEFVHTQLSKDAQKTVQNGINVIIYVHWKKNYDFHLHTANSHMPPTVFVNPHDNWEVKSAKWKTRIEKKEYTKALDPYKFV